MNCLYKFSSGRWILTVTAALVFAILSIRGQIDPKDVMAVVIMVFTLYFTRNDRQPKGEQK